MKGVWRYVFLGIALFVALIGGIVYLAIRLTQPYVDVVKQQGAALSQGDGAAAYDALALTTRDQISEGEFVIMMQDLGLWEDSGEYYFNARNVENGVARLSGTYTRADGAVIPVTFVIVQEQDEMRIISFQFGA